VKGVWHGVGEVKAEDGLDRGLEEDLLAIYRHGKDLDGFSVLAEDLADGCGAAHIILGFTLGFHGFQDGGGSTHDTGPHTLVMHGPT
jgi:hypothetical protein